MIPLHRRLAGAKFQGFTLIEAMVGMALTTLLVIGLSGMWSMVNDQFFQFTLRQKAIFVLHGQMERLAALYRHTNFLQDTTIHPSAFTNTNKLIHKTESNNFIQDLIITKTIYTDISKTDFIQGQILFVNASNIVWLDNQRDVTAKIHWNLDALTTQCYISSGTNNKCHRLTLNLEYPFRFMEKNNPVATMASKTETITLQTLIGQR